MKPRAAFAVERPERADVGGADDDEYELNIFMFAVCVLAEPFLQTEK